MSVEYYHDLQGHSCVLMDGEVVVGDEEYVEQILDMRGMVIDNE